MSSAMATQSVAGDENHQHEATPCNKSQRLYTEKEEIRLLKSFRKISSGATVDPSVLGQLSNALNNKFTETQIASKIRHMKDKYRRHNRTKSLIKTPHDKKTFSLASQIWGKRPRIPIPQEQQQEERPDEVGDDQEVEEEVAVAEEEEGGEDGASGDDLENFPVLVNEVSRCLGGNGVVEKLVRGLGEKKMMDFNEKWIMLRIKEAKLVAERAELEKDQLQALLQLTVSSNAN